MASLTKKIIHGKPYYYLRVCKRVNGKPTIVSQQYIGSQEQLIARLTNPIPEQAAIREWGAVVATYEMAKKLNLVELIDRHVPKRDKRGPSVGQYLVAAAINRCVAPCSKAKMGEWFDSTVLPRLMGMKPAQLSSQRFWDNMDRLSEAAILKIERDLSSQIVSQFNLDLSCLLFDATNFFTFIDSFNDRAHLPQWGHSKEKRTDLRILNLALLVTADGEIPLLHRTYPGNEVDAKAFLRVWPELMRRFRALTTRDCSITLIFDKGNNSNDNLSKIDQAKIHYVGSLGPTQYAKLLSINRKQMRKLEPTRLKGVWAYRTEEKVLGAKRTVVVTYSDKFFGKQWRVLQREINKRKRLLRQLQESLIRCAKSGKHLGNNKPTMDGTQKKINRILLGRWLRSGKHMKNLFHVELKLNENHFPVLSWKFNTSHLELLKQTVLGRSLLFTNRSDWSDEQIILAYRSQHHVEAAFKTMKNPRYIAVRPIHHWTDQKLRVHAFYCVLALLILSLIRRELDKNGLHITIPRILDRLSSIREITTIYRTSDAKKQRAKSVLSEYDQELSTILSILELNKFQPK